MIRPALKDRDAVSLLTKEQRKHLACWPIPNDRHITDHIAHGHSLLLEEVRFSFIKKRTTDNRLNGIPNDNMDEEGLSRGVA
jgi:hypothetical protein